MPAVNQMIDDVSDKMDDMRIIQFCDNPCCACDGLEFFTTIAQAPHLAKDALGKRLFETDFCMNGGGKRSFESKGAYKQRLWSAWVRLSTAQNAEYMESVLRYAFALLPP
jgi:hypothetical protein